MTLQSLQHAQDMQTTETILCN